MKCPKCQFENPERLKFCGECGAKLELLCPGCNSLNPPQFKFCGECGHDLISQAKQPPKELTFAEKLDKIQRYLPGGLTEKILAQRGKIEGERKQVTVMFCDMEGFTPLSERLGLEEVYNPMDKVYEILIHNVHDYGGTVNEMTGDGIMALFGAPIALEDAPQRAIRSALAIHREMARISPSPKTLPPGEKGSFGPPWASSPSMGEARSGGDSFTVKGEPAKGLPSIRMRIGIHTGQVVVGTLGNDLRVEFKAVGDTVNLASRMESMAEPGTTYVTHDTFRLTEGFFRFESFGEKSVKGKEEPVRVYRVVSSSARMTRFDVNSERGLTPFVGRSRELELLLDGFERARGGRGQSLSIVAEAGLGKSRLLYEFRKAVANEDVTFLEGRCLSYSRGEVYYPVADLLKASFDIRETDGDGDVIEKVKRNLQALQMNDADTLPYLLELLPVKESGIEKITMTPEAKKERILEALRRMVIRGSEMRPLIMAVEDLHWMDRSSEEAFRYIFENISGARVLLIFTYRPEFIHTWGGKSYHSQVNLNRLSNRESLAMVHHLLGTDNIETNLEELILERAEGVPFFIEELVKSLKDLRIIERKNGGYRLTKDLMAMAIPGTIQDVIMARVDSLPEPAKGVLQAGSVIGREFGYRLIQRVRGLPEGELLSHLSVLKDSELVYERGIFPRSTYIFKHALTQKVIYDSILTTRRKRLHKETGDAIELLYRDRLDEHFVVLAEHFTASETYEKSVEYLNLARNVALKKAAFAEAISLAERRIACLEKLPQTEEVQKQIINARANIGLLCLNINHYKEGKKAVEPVVDLALKLNHKRGLSGIYTTLGAYYWSVEDAPNAIKYLEEAIKISEEARDMVSFVLANNFLGWTFSCFECDFERALYHLGKSLKINEAARNIPTTVVMKCNIGEAVYFYQGKMELAYVITEEALRLAEESGDIYSKGWACTRYGEICYGKGLFGKAEDILLKGVSYCGRVQNYVVAATAEMYLGEIGRVSGRYREAYSFYIKAMEILVSYLPSSWTNLLKVASALAKVLAGERDIDLESLYNSASEIKLKIVEGQLQRYLGEILLHLDDLHMAEADEYFQKAIEADKRHGMMFQLGLDYLAYVQLFKRKGDTAKARENLLTAAQIFKDCGADGWQHKAETAHTEFA